MHDNAKADGSIRTVFDSDPEASLVQNRLNVAALAFAGLFFSGSFSLSLSGSLSAQNTQPLDYRSEFANVEVAMAMGVILCVLTVCALLVCQQLPADREGLRSRRLWFAMGTLILFLALSQAMSAGLGDVVFGVALFDRSIGVALGILATLAWIILLLVAPIHLVLVCWRALSHWEFGVLLATYGIFLVMILGVNAEIYRAKDNAPSTVCVFASNFLLQLVQPLTWPNPWGT